jgi:hypothetical protein
MVSCNSRSSVMLEVRTMDEDGLFPRSSVFHKQLKHCSAPHRHTYGHLTSSEISKNSKDYPPFPRASDVIWCIGVMAGPTLSNVSVYLPTNVLSSQVLMMCESSCTANRIGLKDNRAELRKYGDCRVLDMFAGFMVCTGSTCTYSKEPRSRGGAGDIGAKLRLPE